MPLINFEVSLNLSWSENCVITNKTTRDVVPNANPPVLEIRVPADTTFKIKDSKLYVSVVILYTQNSNKTLEQ